METKHFSHVHNLYPHQMPDGADFFCSGCKFLGTGSIYACWPCNYFLHEQCFVASRSMQHPSHPSHPLSLFPFPTYPSSSIYCDSCKLLGSGFTYSCSLCEFDLHVHCAYMSYNNIPAHIPPPILEPPQDVHNKPQTAAINHVPADDHETCTVNPQPHSNVSGDDEEVKKNEANHFGHEHALHVTQVKEKDTILCSGCDDIISGSAYICKEFPCNFNLHKSCFLLSREIRHKAHPKHPLTLILSSAEYKDGFTCDACLKDCYGLTYNCSECKFYLHVSCASLPSAARHRYHDHPLSLFYNAPYIKAGQDQSESDFECSNCGEDVPDCAWVYYCRKCDYGTHSYCVIPDYD